MELIIYFILVTICFFYISNLVTKNNYLLDKKNTSIHKRAINKDNVSVIGGFLILLGIIILEVNFYYKFFIFIFFIIGLAFEYKYNINVKYRFIFQIAIILILLYFLDLQINETRILLIDSLLSYSFFNIFFTSFCLLILINGSNFIDGINLNSSGYFLAIYSSIFFNLNSADLIINNQSFIILILTIFSFYLLNFLNKVYLGDGGVYAISLFTGLFLIEFSNNNLTVSPFLIVLFLWYPAFENLFSIIRKLEIKKSPLKPDNKHLHHLIYFYLKRKFNLKSKLAYLNLPGFIINIYNLIFFMIGTKFYFHSQLLILLIITNIAIYLITYFKIIKFLKKSN